MLLQGRWASCSETIPSPYRALAVGQPYSYLRNGPLRRGFRSVVLTLRVRKFQKCSPHAPREDCSGWHAISAVRNKEVCSIESADILQPGPSILAGVKQMAGVIERWRRQVRRPVSSLRKC